jgi:hypothetical protein
MEFLCLLCDRLANFPNVSGNVTYLTPEKKSSYKENKDHEKTTPPYRNDQRINITIASYHFRLQV